MVSIPSFRTCQVKIILPRARENASGAPSEYQAALSCRGAQRDALGLMIRQHEAQSYIAWESSHGRGCAFWGENVPRNVPGRLSSSRQELLVSKTISLYMYVLFFPTTAQKVGRVVRPNAPSILFFG